jgi:hypothetical protein
LALKKNQPSLYNEVTHFFNVAEQSEYFHKDSFESVEKGHGRIEQPTCVCLDVCGELDHVSSGWTDLISVAKIHSIHEINGKKQEQTRYFISSLGCNAGAVARAARQHWSIENSLQKDLDTEGRSIHAIENISSDEILWSCETKSHKVREIGTGGLRPLSSDNLEHNMLEN